MKNRLKNTIVWALVGVVALFVAGCSDWTETESLKIDENDINKQNPELYAQYLSALRGYKKTDHKIFYASYDNVEVPFSQAHHLMAIPDSVDIVSLKHADNLPQWIIGEMTEVRAKKGTRCVYTVSFPELEAAWAAQIPPEVTEEGDPEPENPVVTFINAWMDKALAICGKYPYDGIVLDYPGKSTVTMSDAQKADYLARQQAFFTKVKTWHAANVSKTVLFQGNPQYTSDSELLAECEYLILPTGALPTLEAIEKAYVMACVNGVPIDRFLIGVQLTSLNTSDVETGYFGKKRALEQAAYWTVEPSAEYTKAGVAVDNLQRDYFYIDQVYKYSREAISIMNPAPKN